MGYQISQDLARRLKRIVRQLESHFDLDVQRPDPTDGYGGDGAQLVWCQATNTTAQQVNGGGSYYPGTLYYRDEQSQAWVPGATCWLRFSNDEAPATSTYYPAWLTGQDGGGNGYPILTVLDRPDASHNQAGVVNLVPQTLGKGDKTFSHSIIVNADRVHGIGDGSGLGIELTAAQSPQGGPRQNCFSVDAKGGAVTISGYIAFGLPLGNNAGNFGGVLIQWGNDGTLLWTPLPNFAGKMEFDAMDLQVKGAMKANSFTVGQAGILAGSVTVIDGALAAQVGQSRDYTVKAGDVLHYVCGVLIGIN